jgi:acetyltransferase-like isoleucine patch superfamily enzyme
MVLGYRSSAFFTYLFNSFVTYCPISTVRIMWLRFIGLKCPDSVSIFRGVSVYGAANIVLGERVVVGYNVCLDARGGITVGRDTVISSYCHLLTADHDVDCPDFSGRLESISIGSHCWICTRSLVLKGVILGDYSVVAGNSVVTKDVPDSAIVGGVPAKFIRHRLCSSDYMIP